MENNNHYTVDELLEAWKTVSDGLSSREDTHIVPRKPLRRGYLTSFRLQCLLQMLHTLLSVAMLIWVVLLGQRRVYDWLGLVPYLVASCLLLYTLMAAVSELVKLGRDAPYRVDVVRRPAVRLLRPVPTVSVTAVLMFLLVDVTPVYSGEIMRASNARIKAEALSSVESMRCNLSASPPIMPAG